jgi:hypothetical protein
MTPNRTSSRRSPAAAFRRVGTPRFRLEPVTSVRLPFVAEVACVECGRPFAIRYGAAAAVFRIGPEVVAVCCDGCLTDESRARLEQLRNKVAS